jgi:SnoaL-like domain
MSPRRIALVVAALLAALVVGLWLHQSDEEQVREAADAIVDAANEDPSALSRALEQHATEDVSVTVSDLPEPLVGRNAIVAAAARTSVQGRKLSFRLQGVEVLVEGSSARLNAQFVATLQLGLRGMSRSRSGAALFQKIDGRFRLVSAEVGGER